MDVMWDNILHVSIVKDQQRQLCKYTGDSISPLVILNRDKHVHKQFYVV